MKNRFKQCNKCRKMILTDCEIGRNNDNGDDEISRLRYQVGHIIEMDN